MTTETEYNEIDAHRWTEVADLDVSERLYQHRVQHRLADTLSLRKGRAVHCAVLEPERFKNEYVTYTERRAGAKWKDFQEAHEHSEILSETEMRTTFEQAVNLQDLSINAFAVELLSKPGRREHLVTWTNEITGTLCKARIDLLTDDGDKVELKTAKDVTKRGFANQCGSLAYHGQDAFYSEGLRANGLAPKNSWIVVVESKPPYDVAVYRVTEECAAAGQRHVDRLMHKLKAALESDYWPGVCPETLPLDLPDWVHDRDLEMEVDGVAAPI